MANKKYGSVSKYGDSTRLFGGSEVPFNYKILLRDNTNGDVNAADWHGRLIKELTGKNISASWSFNRIGGCGEAVIRIAERFDEYEAIEADYRVEILVNQKYRDTYEKVYMGFVVDKQPIFGTQDSVEIRCMGFSAQLHRIIIGAVDPYIRTKETDTLKSTVTDIIKNHAAKRTDIIWYQQDDGNDHQNPDYGYNLIHEIYEVDTPTKIYSPEFLSFSQSAYDCMNYLVDIAGNYVWGVDKNRLFYFRKASTSIVKHYWYGSNVSNYSQLESFEGIKNRIWIKSGEYSEIFERDSDRLAETEQTTHTDEIACGKTTTFNKLKQTFTTTKKSISKITLKVGDITGSESGGMEGVYCGKGFDELITDGNMEESGTSNWTATSGPGTTVQKSSLYAISKGITNQSLEVSSLLPENGAYQEISGLSDGAYGLSFRYRIARGDMKVEVYPVNAEGEVGDIPFSSYRFTGRTWQGGFINKYFSFNIIDSPASIRVYFISDAIWLSKFYIDQVSMLFDAPMLKVTLADDSDDTILKESYERMQFEVKNLPTSSSDSTEFDVEVQYFGCLNDGVSTYAIILETDSSKSDTAYFTFRKNSAGGYANGTLKYSEDDGTTWKSVAGEDLWFKVWYNVSQEKYGLREDIAPAPPSTDVNLQRKWVDGYLSKIDRPLSRVSFKLSGLREEIERGIPHKSVYKTAFRGPGGKPLPVQSNKDDTKTKDIDNENFTEQSFQHSHDLTVSSVILRGKKNNSPTGTIYVEIQTDNIGVPSGSVVDNGTSATLDVAVQAGAATDVTFTFSTEPELLANKQYWIVAKGSYAEGANTFAVVYYDAADSYSKGRLVYNEDGTRSEIDFDLYFEITGSETITGLDIERINYTITENGLDAQISAGRPLPELAHLFGRTQHLIQNQTTTFGFGS